MKGKIALLVGGAAGYVLGTRAGRERYEQIRTQAQSIWQSPTVQEKATQAQDFAKQQAPVVKDKAAQAASGAAGAAKDAASSVKDKAGSGDDQGSGDLTGGTGDQKAPYPTSATTGLS